MDSSESVFTFGGVRELRKCQQLEVSYNEERFEGSEITESERNDELVKKLATLEAENLELKRRSSKLESLFDGYRKSTRVSDSGVGFGSKKCFLPTRILL